MTRGIVKGGKDRRADTAGLQQSKRWGELKDMTGALLKKAKDIERRGVKHSSKINEVLDNDR